MSDFGEMLEYLFRDKRTKRQKFWDRFWFYAFIVAFLAAVIGIGIAIGVYCF